MHVLLASSFEGDPRRGGPRVLFGLGEELAQMGTDVQWLWRGDVVASEPRTKVGGLLQRRFSRRVLPLLRARAGGLDVIDACEGVVPFSKRELGFDGLLVARIVQLSAVLDEFTREARKRWPVRGRELGNPVIDRMRDLRWVYERSDFQRSWKHADLILVANHEEREYLAASGYGDKVRVLPHGIAHDRRLALRKWAAEPAARLARREVAFIGYWYGRKGAYDWGEIVRAVRRQVPDARFNFVGTWFGEEVVLGDLGLPPCDWVRVHATPDSEEIPSLVGPSTVAGFPSYLENFGLAVVEHLAAGQPTIAYDIAGPRDTLAPLAPEWLAPPGDTSAFADRLVAMLQLSVEEYSALSARCIEHASAFAWERVARDTIDLYEEGLNDLSGVSQAA